MSLSITLIHLCHEDDDTRHLTHHADLTPLLSINQFIISLEPVVWDPFHEQDQRPRTMLKHCSKLSLLEEKSASTLSLSNAGITETGVTSPSQDSRDKRSSIIRVWTEDSQGSYRTVAVTSLTTCQEVISRLVSRVRVSCADPKLHRLEMRVIISPGNIKTVSLEEAARLSEIVECNPWDNYKLFLVTKQFSPVRIWDKISGDVVFRTLLLTRDCSVERALDMIHKFYPDLGRQSLAVYEESELLGFRKMLMGAEILSRVTESWEAESQFKLVLRRYDAPDRKNRIPTMHTFLQSMLRVADQICEHSSADDVSDSGNDTDGSFNSSESEFLTDVSSINSDSFLYVPCL